MYMYMYANQKTVYTRFQKDKVLFRVPPPHHLQYRRVAAAEVHMTPRVCLDAA